MSKKLPNELTPAELRIIAFRLFGPEKATREEFGTPKELREAATRLGLKLHTIDESCR